MAGLPPKNPADRMKARQQRKAANDKEMSLKKVKSKPMAAKTVPYGPVKKAKKKG